MTEGESAHAIFAESVGKGGGVGGTGAGIVGVGGSGDGGGSAGFVSVTNAGRLITTGKAARGIFAQSVGGGGGAANGTGGLVSVGGSAGGGGTGGRVYVKNTGSIATGNATLPVASQVGSDGIFAQSTGGGGGSGSASGGLVSLGGKGGGGGGGGQVDVVNEGIITTQGVRARGIFAQSIGGGGGTGGDSGGLVSIGGTGGSGALSTGGAVTVTNSGSVTTTGAVSSAIQAQSIGGGGGDGGTSGSVLLSIGGAGSGGGDGGTVTVNNQRNLTTYGNDSHGIFAQSVGGGGGNGGASYSVSAFAGVSLGGDGKAGGKGGQVELTFKNRTATGEITTSGDRSRGVFAQSVGGGGGSGGLATQMTVGFGGAVSLAIGGKGESGGAGGLVHVGDVVGCSTASTCYGTSKDDLRIVTSGDNSEGMYIQSVGGGGGSGGYAISTAVAASPGAAVSLSAAVGGSAGKGGAGGNVIARTGGSILTGEIGGAFVMKDGVATTEVRNNGEFSTGLLAQSVGGGGGKGGFSISASVAAAGGGALALAGGIGGSGGTGGDGGLSDVDFNGSITTLGDDAAGALIQSVGGGGGSGGYNISGAVGLSGGAGGGGSLGIGGSGDTGGAGGTALGTIGGEVQTVGDRSTGVIVQSVGGGGGNGGFNISGALGAAGGTGGAVAVGLGGTGKGGGIGGRAEGRTLSTIDTWGDDSGGLLVQSVGGGGGNGGFNVAGTIGAGGGVGGAVSVGIGGSAGTGSTGGYAFGDARGAVTTRGFRSVGVTVQSLGGGGGNGGFNVSGSLGGGGIGGGAISVGLGGTGGGGGGGGEVHGFATSIHTFKAESTGFLAQSVGGGGGNGGFSIAGSIGAGGTVGGALSVSVGGSGGTGGSAGWTEGRVSGQVITEGENSSGVVVQSLGGGGGNGGFTVAGGIGGGGTAGGTINVGVGGSGGTAGHGGTVDASAAGITTTGDRSGGFLAQSVGGGGGNGGFSIGAGIGGGGTGGGAISVSVGGAGAGGGTGGKVTGTVTGLVLTEGKSSTGVTVQSLGGGGGNGGFSVAGGIGGGGTGGGAISVGLGGSGGGAGQAGEVHGFAQSIGTKGENSSGFLAQSVGGGGGNGGFSIAGSIGAGGTGGGAISVSIGGSGSEGGNAGYVEGRVSGLVSTQGVGSTGVIVQSMGGGGGNGAFSVAGGIGGGGTGGGAISVGLGGNGGKAGDGGEVDASAVAITTTKDQSGGFLAQSVGGGGGNGGFSVAGSIGAGGTGGGAISVGIGGTGAGGGEGKRVGASVMGNVYTAGTESDAIVAQSLGGGGGNGGFAVAGSIGGGGTGAGAVGVGIGGSGKGGGNAGQVDLTVTGMTETLGKDSDGIIAQSVGGGGGNGGFAVTGSIAAGGTGAGTVGVSVGGSGGDGGNSIGKVTLNVTGGAAASGKTVAVQTQSAGGRGVLAQSIGGGGGNGGFTVVAGISLAKTGAGNVGVGVGGSGGKGGYASAVEGNVTGDVTTLGASDAAGVLIQSVGGGGGNGGFNVSGGLAASTKGAGNVLVGVGGMGGDGGASGAVTGKVSGDVYTAGANSGGVTYQSLAGGGGNGGFNVTGAVALTAGDSGGSGNIGVGVGGFGGKASHASLVNASVIGNVTTMGEKSHGILMQSVGGGGGQGGFNVTGSLTASAGKGGNIGVGLGGFGGGGGNASSVDGTLSGDVYTRGNEAYGATLQSMGGSGGNGGFNVTASATLTSGDNGSIGVGIGGFGLSGGTGGNVHGDISGKYETHGVNSDGVVVQSVGGSGGNGGLNVTGQLSLSAKGKSGQASVGIGGFGGDGGASGTAWLKRTGDTLTTGKDSEAIIVQSLAGGGGNGAINVTGGLVASSADNASINIGIGGFGGKASHADAVTATVIGNVWATGMGAGAGGSDSPNLFSGALVAQSVGGGGGNGGLNVSGGVSLTKSASSGKAAAIGIGGFGGGGGNGGTVDLTVKAPASDRVQVIVDGDNRAAIIAQSLGGGGGLGGLNVSGGIASNSALAFGMGGFGGDGGLAKKVTADVDADIQATGDGARGLFAQSLGGGGGAGGINVSGTVNINSKDDTSITFGLGGFGGTGNISGDVDVKQKGLVIVTGKNAFGIVAQSVAGGGGDGGLNVSANIANASAGKSTNRIVAGVGGTAGGGADAGDVKLNSVGAITVTGPDSTSTEDNADDELTVVFNAGGLLAQSVGGGGGVGGMNITATVARNAGNTLQFGMGGNGGAGGNGGMVRVNRGYETVAATETVNASAIQTTGDYSTGLIAQSVGGGGGIAGMNFNFAYNKESNPDDGKTYKAAIISVGGSGADAGNGDVVVVRHNGSIATDGRYSHGLIAQSIGGGGGDSHANLGAGALGGKTKGVNIGVGGANGSGGSGAAVTVDHVGQITTQGDSSVGIKAQSIGGGGGSASSINKILDPVFDFVTGQADGSSLAVNIGRAGGKGATSGAVTVGSDGSIVTEGDESIGILAQSIGGGGGDSGTTTVGGDFEGKSGSYGGNLAIGLDGGESAIGGAVTVTTKGLIHTAGDRAHAIFAQSLGGGGGMGGTVGDKLTVSPGGDEDTTSANINIGGGGGKGSHSDQVTVINSATLWTQNDRSSGIWAQSIGGSGGAGGDYLQANIESVKADKTTRTFNLNVGGSGGEGAVGYGVKVTNSGAIQTDGLQSFGIRAESIGGGGGDGGAVAQGTLTTGGGSKQSIDINVGGTGGEGAEAGLVEVRNEGSIVTKGFAAEGIRATSTGGGGGNAGVILHTLLASNSGEGQTQALTMNFGGSGGKGGTGGNVKVENVKTATTGSGTIWTTGDSAHGIFAQSLGGGGGNGSSIVSMTGLRGSADSISVGLHFGGKGGKGNHSGTVGVDNSGGIFTDGKDAYGILAQSTGGGGGNGGLVIAAAASIGQKSKTPVLAIGGIGGDGGYGGDVTVTNSGIIQTTGAGGHGIVAQSIGGGGGNAGVGLTATDNLANVVASNLIALAVGATGGGKGGAGGNVTVNQTGNITVTGEGAQAIVAESINGGGGRLDFSIDGVSGLPGSSVVSLFKDVFDIKDEDVVEDPKIAARLGGSDLTDMNAGKVKIISKGTLGVGGDNGVASFDQSVGGGGGSVHIKTRQVDAASMGDTVGAAAIAYSVSLGGSNGVNNSGADIDNTHEGALITTGRNSVGVLSQTIGGGGGHAIVDITTEAGALVGPINLAFGSQSGSHETGGDILRRQTGSVMTTGDLSTGVILQSIGGGGGASTVRINGVEQTNLAIHTSLGADGGTELGGGSVTGSYDGLQTEGNHAIALLVQSIGAGGGSVLTAGSDAVNVTLGGKNGASGNAGEIKLTNAGTISSSGIGSHAVLLQSIGGGGGAVLSDATTITTHLNAGNTGNGGLVDFTQTGSIIATGNGANGLIAQSLGGGGGWVDGVFAGSAGGDGKGGAITLNLSGSTFATGTGGTAVLAQSLGKSGAGNITIVSNGTVRGYAAGIRVDGGATNTVTTSGSVSAVSGVTISSGSGNDRVINTGLVIGNIDLGSGSNAFENRAGSTFVAFSTIDLRDPAINASVPLAIQSALPTAAIIPAPGGTFANDGDFLMGLSATPRPIDLAKGAVFANLDGTGNPANNLMYGSRVINTVALDGHFVQSDTGHMAFDVAYGPYASDRVNVTGNTTVDGTGDVVLTWLENAAPVTLFATAGTSTDNGLDFTDSIALDYRVLANTSGIQLAFTSDFSQPFLNRNQGELGRHMDSAIRLGESGGIGRVMALIGNLQVGDEAAYAAIFDQLNPEAFLAPQTLQLGAARQFAADLNHCGATGQDTCVWARVGGTDIERDADAETHGHNGAYDSLATGFERRVDDKWSIAGAIGFDHINRLYVGNGRASMEGDSVHAGVSATRTLGGVKLGLALTGGLQTVETQRLQHIFDPLVGTATPHSSYVSAQAKLSRRFDRGAWFIEPSAALAVTSIHQGAFTEEGMEGQGAVGVSHTQTFATLTPELTVGYNVQESSGQRTALSFNVGAVVYSTDRLKMPYRLVGANQTSDPALISTQFDSDTVKMGANVQVTGKNDRASLNLSLANESGKRYSQQTFSASLKFKF
ncbi:outer membrane autotransporter barrel domain protein [Asticcacaulis biprosthecium C19]|uniref:Outer membrane autotransporter barrel domain protein n=1 Tax=Asticcacaulis biprosthecium C19 TaxID=715226 RepID=F4QIB0_9CAUL|nr:autotransporter outer membrane beta-barrel domain-containing protein [Asticcacaulis biprosthecium]EGF91748.1 outer membrane autotransporter barrel domain protein [Asticcacaulis biprosthecium C19]